MIHHCSQFWSHLAVLTLPSRTWFPQLWQPSIQGTSPQWPIPCLLHLQQCTHLISLACCTLPHYHTFKSTIEVLSHQNRNTSTNHLAKRLHVSVSISQEKQCQSNGSLDPSSLFLHPHVLSEFDCSLLTLVIILLQIVAQALTGGLMILVCEKASFTCCSLFPLRVKQWIKILHFNIQIKLLT